MNNPNPFVPKGSLLEQQSQRRSRLKIVVGCVVALSSLSLVVMLVQGCHREAPEPTPPEAANPPVIDTNSTPESSNAPNIVAAPPVSAPNNQPGSVPMPPQTQPQVQPAVPQAPLPPPVMNPPVVETPAVGAEYTIVSGDTLAKIAKKNGVTVKALEAANPGVDPKKLRPGKKLTIPAGGSAAAPAAGAPATVGAADSTGGEVYVVKSGDTLTKIAKSHGVTLRALRAANSGRSSDHLKVGDKLNIPAKAEAAAPAPAPAPVPEASQLPPVPAPTQAPSPVVPAPSSPAPAPGH